MLRQSAAPKLNKTEAAWGDYLRASLPKLDESMSTVGEEVERSRAYLEVLKIRMGSRLNVVIDVADDVKALPLPPMMVQTLVENAIKHGLEPKCGTGTIWIRASRAGDLLPGTAPAHLGHAEKPTAPYMTVVMPAQAN